MSALTTTFARIPSLAIVTALGVLYVCWASGRWSLPMLLDAGLAALFLAHPSIKVLAIVLLAGAVRWVRPWAETVVLILKLDGYHGWTAHATLFLLPALRASVATEALPPMVGQTVALPRAPAEPPQLLLNEALKLLNNDPTAPHLGVIGPTRLGKTTFVGMLLSYRQGEELVIATPKARQYDPWFGADVARPRLSADDIDFAPLSGAITLVYRELLRRNTPGASAAPPITLVLDEWPQIAELPGVARQIINMLRMGAACGVRLVLMATDVNVRGWHMDGTAGVLDNLVFARVEEGRRWSVGRLDANWRMVAPRLVETSQVWGLSQRVTLAGRGWSGVREVVAPVPVGAGGAVPVEGGGLTPSGTVPGTGNGNGTGNSTPIEVLRALRNAGYSRERARALGCVFRDLDWTEAGQ